MKEKINKQNETVHLRNHLYCICINKIFSHVPSTALLDLLTFVKENSARRASNNNQFNTATDKAFFRGLFTIYGDISNDNQSEA